MTAPVSYDIVTRVRKDLDRLSTRQLTRMVKEMEAEQPALIGYLLALQAYGLPQEELEGIFYLGITVWQMMKRGHPGLRTVSIEQLEQAEDANTEAMELLEKDPQADFFSFSSNVVETHPEPEVLRFIVEAIMETAPDEMELSPEAKGIAFLHLKSELETLARSLRE